MLLTLLKIIKVPVLIIVLYLIIIKKKIISPIFLIFFFLLNNENSCGFPFFILCSNFFFEYNHLFMQMVDKSGDLDLPEWFFDSTDDESGDGVEKKPAACGWENQNPAKTSNIDFEVEEEDKKSAPIDSENPTSAKRVNTESESGEDKKIPAIDFENASKKQKIESEDESEDDDFFTVDLGKIRKGSSPDSSSLPVEGNLEFNQKLVRTQLNQVRSAITSTIESLEQMSDPSMRLQLQLQLQEHQDYYAELEKNRDNLENLANEG